MPNILGGRRRKDVEISCSEHEGIKDLSDERDACIRQLCSMLVREQRKRTLSTAVGVYSPYQNKLRRRVRHVAEDVEEVEFHRGYKDGYTVTRQPPVVGVLASKANGWTGHAVPVRLSANERESLSRCARQQFPS